MAETYNFIEYTPEVAAAIRKARDLPVRGDGQSPWPEHNRQQLLPPMMSDADPAEYVQKGPFDVEIVFTGTDENPAWKARVLNSSDKGESGIAGLLIIGTRQFAVANAEFVIGTEMETIFLEVNYDPDTNEYSYELKISDNVPQGTNRKFIKSIASVWIYHSTPYISMYVQRENIEVTGRWV